MGLADVAKLIVELRLDDKLSGPLRGISGRFNRLGVDTALLNQGLGKVGRGLAVGLRNSAILGAAAAAGLATQVLAGVASLRELEDVNAQTSAAIESTGGAAGITADQVRDLAEKYEDLGGVIDDKVIQSAENVLLTFTDIRKDAFEPALEAALDLSTRMGGDLGGAALQVGKALQDPIRGLTALRRVGVNFTDDQEALIRSLVEENDMYGAQQVILGELEEEFGGSFAARGRTQEATIGRMKDAIEGLQQSLATAFIPVIDKVARKLTDLFNNPETIKAVKNFGDNLAGFFTDDRLDAAGDAVKGIFGYLASVPWGTIGQGLSIAGEAARKVIDVFNALPKEVQGIVITALAANKLSGGLLASGIGDIGKALTGNFFQRGSSPANPLFVSAIGGGLGGPGAPVAGGGGLLGGVAKFVLGPAAAVAIGAEIAAAINAPVIGPAKEFEEGEVNAVLDSADSDRIVDAIVAIQDQQNTDDILAQTALIASNIPFISDALGGVGPKLEEQKKVLRDQLLAQGFTNKEIDSLIWNAEQERARQAAYEGRNIGLVTKQVTNDGMLIDEAKQNRTSTTSRLDSLAAKVAIASSTASGKADNLLGAMSQTKSAVGDVATRVGEARDRLGVANAKLATIAAKDFSPTISLLQTVNVSATLSASDAAAAIQINNTIRGRGRELLGVTGT